MPGLGPIFAAQSVFVMVLRKREARNIMSRKRGEKGQESLQNSSAI